MTSQVTGEMLYRELCEAAGKSGASLAGFVAPLFNGNSWKIEQLRIARLPKAETIERVRALCAGQPVERPRASRWQRDRRALGLTRLQAEDAGIQPSKRSVYEGQLLSHAEEMKAQVEWRRSLGEQAHLTRRPGQTLEDRVRELEVQQSASEAGDAQPIGGGSQ